MKQILIALGAIVVTFVSSADAQMVACTTDKLEHRLTFSWDDHWILDPVDIPDPVPCVGLRKNALKTAAKLIKQTSKKKASKTMGMSRKQIKHNLSCQQLADRLNKLTWSSNLAKAVGTITADLYLFDETGELEDVLEETHVPCYWQVAGL